MKMLSVLLTEPIFQLPKEKKNTLTSFKNSTLCLFENWKGEAK